MKMNCSGFEKNLLIALCLLFLSTVLVDADQGGGSNNPPAKLSQEFVMTFEKIRTTGGKIKCIVFGPTNSWSIIYDRNGFYSRNVPMRAHELMLDAQNSGEEIKCLGLTSSGGWTVITDQRYESFNVDPEAVSLMNKFTSEGHSLKWVSYLPGGKGFSILYGHNGYFNRGVSKSFHELMVDAGNKGYEFKSVVFRHNGGGTFLFEKCGNLSENVPVSAINEFKLRMKNDQEIRAVGYGPGDSYFIDYEE